MSSYPSPKETARYNMPITKFVKGDEVRVDAKKFDGEGELDELGLKFSERWLRETVVVRSFPQNTAILGAGAT